MTRLFFTLILIGLCLPVFSSAADGVQCRLTVSQYDTQTESYALLFEDSATFAKDTPASGLVGPFSVEVRFTGIDSASVQFSAQVITLGPPVNTYSRAFLMEYSLPARIDDIEVKNGSRYNLVITPLKKVETDDDCDYSHRTYQTFSVLPAAFMDIYYVPTTLADFHAHAVREYLDIAYRRFQVFAGFTLPGKTSVYLCPCQINSVIWDNRFGMAVDPTRGAAYGIYNKNVNTVDPFVLIYSAMLRNYGYAPPFIAEGLAGYYSFFAPDMKRILKENDGLSIESFLNTHAYLTADPLTADRASASFVRYLIDSYGLDRLREVYAASDDLNLRQKLEETYGKSAGELDGEWKRYVDTLTVSAKDYFDFAQLAEQMLNYNLMLDYSRRSLEISTDSRDSVRAARLLGRAYFYTADYYGAAEIQSLLIGIDSGQSSGYMARGSYRMMNGDYSGAFEDYSKAHDLDPDNNLVDFNLALYYLCQGDDSTARAILLDNIGSGKQAAAQGEGYVMLANILNESGSEADRQAATDYYHQAVGLFEQAISIYRASSTHYMWLGVAKLGLGDVNPAIENLKAAEFLETRPFYSGMINLWLGKAMLKAGDKQAAEEYFANVLRLPSAECHQAEAKKYLEQL
ncbi:MAG: hypothetical protein AB1483_08370 [Candidatus Zixiibacteriota bacterium]